MVEYIDKGAAKRAVDLAMDLTETEYDIICAKIDQCPAADVVPVRRGTWEIGRGTDNFDIKCSECGYTDIFGVCGVLAVKIEAKLVHYCPNCGARMKAGR